MEHALPKSVNVLGQKVTIRTHPDLVVELPGGPVECLGVWDDGGNLIVLDPAQAPDRMRQTLLHETLHAVFSKAGMRDQVTHELEENIVNRVAPVLLEVLRRNPAVYTYLTGRRLW